MPNLYPAFERQEVVAHAPEHVRTLAELDDGQLALVAEAWRRRAEAAAAEGFGYVHALVNEGRAAGASLLHSHSQLVWLREPPPAVAAESGAGCRLCELVSAERGGTHVVAERDGLLLLAHPAPRGPYELLVVPLDHDPDGFRSDRLPAALGLLADAVRRLRAAEGPVPWNAWLHHGSHWHVEVLPRLTVFAGVELGAGIWVSTVAPEDAAAALRQAGG